MFHSLSPFVLCEKCNNLYFFSWGSATDFFLGSATVFFLLFSLPDHFTKFCRPHKSIFLDIFSP
jgi:hypothetical protein